MHEHRHPAILRGHSFHGECMTSRRTLVIVYACFGVMDVLHGESYKVLAPPRETTKHVQGVCSVLRVTHTKGIPRQPQAASTSSTCQQIFLADVVEGMCYCGPLLRPGLSMLVLRLIHRFATSFETTHCEQKSVVDSDDSTSDDTPASCTWRMRHTSGCRCAMTAFMCLRMHLA